MVSSPATAVLLFALLSALLPAGCGGGGSTAETDPPCLCGGACTGAACDPCDAGLAIDSDDPLDAAKAMGICRNLVSAEWLLPDGSPAPADADYALGHGLLSGFGPNVAPTLGTRLLGLSSGTARQVSDPGYVSPVSFDKGYTSGSPGGFPKEAPACPGVVTGIPHDGVALEVTLDVPERVHGFAFDFDFYTTEWPGYICSTYNDFFLAIVSPIPAGQTDGNVAFDAMGNPVSVNAAFMEVCGCVSGPPCVAGGITFQCPLGTSELQGTGFTDHAATGWRTVQVPASPGSRITIRFTTYDSGDGILDSTALVDNFRWLAAGP